MDPHPKWLIARDPERSRLLVIHTEHPGFRAEVLPEEDDEAVLAPLSYALADGRTLAHFVWYDEPAGNLVPLLAEVDEALATYRAARRRRQAPSSRR